MSGQARQHKLAERTKTLYLVLIELNSVLLLHVNGAVVAQVSL